MRERIAQAAARLIAEDGIQDYALAKRKAARQMGAEGTHNLPANSEVEQALRAYQELYQPDEQRERLMTLREQALQTMRLLAPFNPYLAGSVLKGTATRYSNVNLHLFTDSAKEVELFLLNRKMPYDTRERRFFFGEEQRAVPLLVLEGQNAEVEIAVFEGRDLRHPPRNTAEGKSLEQASTAQLEALMAAERSRYTDVIL